MDIKIIVGLIGLGGAILGSIIGGTVTIVATTLAQNRIDKRQREQREEKRREKLRGWVESKFVENGIDILYDHLLTIQHSLQIAEMVANENPDGVGEFEPIYGRLDELSEVASDDPELAELLARTKSDLEEAEKDTLASMHGFFYERLESSEHRSLPHSALRNVMRLLGNEMFRRHLIYLHILTAGDVPPRGEELAAAKLICETQLETLSRLRDVLRRTPIQTRSDIDRLAELPEVEALYRADESGRLLSGEDAEAVLDGVDERKPASAEG